MKKKLFVTSSILLLSGVGIATPLFVVNLNKSKANKELNLFRNINGINGQELEFSTDDISSLYKNSIANYKNALWLNLTSSKFKVELARDLWISNVEKLEKFHSSLTSAKVKEFWKYKDNQLPSNKKTILRPITNDASITNAWYDVENVDWEQYKIQNGGSTTRISKEITNLNTSSIGIGSSSINLAKGKWTYYIAGSPYPYPKDSTDFVDIELNPVKFNFSKISDDEYSVSLPENVELKTKDYIDTRTTTEKIDYETNYQYYDFNTGQTISESPLIVKNNKNTLDFSDFFVISPNYVEHNNSYYLNKSPKIEFNFNLPLINALEQYKRIPERFNKLYSCVDEFYKALLQEKHLINILFGSIENVRSFLNSWLINLANNFYSLEQIDGIEQFLGDFVKSNNKTEFKVIIDQLKSSDVEYSKFILPVAKVKTQIETPYQKIIENKINSIRYLVKNTVELEKELWFDSSLKSYDSSNYKWNVWTDVVLANVMNMDIVIDYVDAFGNEYANVTIYDGQNKKFNNDLIKVAPVPTNDNNYPYSTTKITRINFGGIKIANELSIDSTIDSLEEFEKFVNQSKTFATFNNEKLWTSYDFDNNLKFLSSSSNGIEIKFRYLAEEKQIEEGAWSDIQGDAKISPFMLIPDEAWGAGESFDTNPNSSLEDILNDLKSKELFERALARPFIMKKDITTQDLINAKRKYVETIEKSTTIFSKGNIGDIFLTKSFKDKYNEKSNKPWWTWTFKELVLEEFNYQNKVNNSVEVVIKNYYQEEWFKNFVANEKLANKTLQDFFPKNDAGRFFVIGSYKPSIDSTQVKLKEEAGFFYAGEQRDAFNQITNFNYVVELEVKNKTYSSLLNEFDFGVDNYNGKLFSYDEYLILMKSKLDWIKKHFEVRSDRFNFGQIKAPIIDFVEIKSDNPFVQNGYGYLRINYQDSIPLVYQIGNDVVYEQLPFDLMKIFGMEKFLNKYSKYIIDNKNEYLLLSQKEQSMKILIDNISKEILIGGNVFAIEQNFKLLGAKQIITIPSKYLDPNIEKVIGFDQETKNIVTLDDVRKKWNSYSQNELFDNLFGRYNFNNQAQLLKDTLRDNNVTLGVTIDDDLKFWYWYTWPNVDDNGSLAWNYPVDPIQLKEIKEVRTDKINLSSFKYGYNFETDSIISFNVFLTKVKNVKDLVKYFNLDNDREISNFLNGIKEIKILEQNETNKLIKFQITLNEEYVLYNKDDSLIFEIDVKEIIKSSLGSLDLKNMSNEVKNKLFKLTDGEKVNYLNGLDLKTKISFFNKLKNDNDEVKNITFAMINNNLVADIEFKNQNIVLGSKVQNSISDFNQELKKSLGIIDVAAKKDNKMVIVGSVIGVVGGLLTFGLLFIFIRRKNQKSKHWNNNSNHNLTIKNTKEI